MIGTSFSIPGFNDIVKTFAARVKANGGLCVLVNMEQAAVAWVSPDRLDEGVFQYQCRPKTLSHLLSS